MRGAGRKFAAVAALLALLLPGLSVLAGALSAADLPACCGTAYCPMHHRQLRDPQNDKINCDSMGMPGHDCSMRSCNTASAPMVGAVIFVLVAPVTLNGPVVAEAAPASASRFSPNVAAVPLSPPPRAIPS